MVLNNAPAFGSNSRYALSSKSRDNHNEDNSYHDAEDGQVINNHFVYLIKCDHSKSQNCYLFI